MTSPINASTSTPAEQQEPTTLQKCLGFVFLCGPSVAKVALVAGAMFLAGWYAVTHVGVFPATATVAQLTSGAVLLGLVGSAAVLTLGMVVLIIMVLPSEIYFPPQRGEQ